jgi:vitamin B12 transporter
MKKTTISSLIGLLLSTPAFAATTMINADDVVVTASRVAQSKESVIADVTVITREEIERAGQSTFAELLQTQPGVEISSNGGMGSNASIYLRGSNTNQVVVLVDGVRIGSVTSGTTNFGNISLSQIDRIEILRGPASALYGQDAVGGVIQIFTKKGNGNNQVNASVGYGAYNTKNAQLGVTGTLDSLNYSFNASSIDSDGISALKLRSDPRNDKDGYRNLSVSTTVSYMIADGHELGIRLFNSDGRVKYDSESSASAFSNYADLTQTSIGLFSKNQMNDVWNSTLKVSESVDENNNQSSATSKSNIKSQQKQYSWQNDFNLPLGKLTLMYDRLEQKLFRTMYEQTTRNTDGFFVGYFADIQNHSVQANLREDHSSQFGDRLTGNLGYGYRINDNFRFTTNIGTAFKAPTFMDLYYVDIWGAYNNPALKAEESKNVEASLKYKTNKESATITVYQNKINNFIALDQNWLPANYDATLRGVTLSGSKDFESFFVKGSADIQSPENDDQNKLLPRRAKRHGALNVSKKILDWNFSAELIGSSERYNDTANESRMSGYAVMNITADYKITSEWALQARLNNLLDKNYAIALSTNDGVTPYNTPGANLFVSLRYSPSF